MKISKRWYKKAEIYKIFAEPWKERCSFTQKDAEELYAYESGLGKYPDIDNIFSGCINGYAVGKKWCDWQVNAWLKSCQLFINGEEQIGYIGWYNIITELLNDPTFPKWWIVSIFKNFVYSKGHEIDENGIHFLDENKLNAINTPSVP